MPSNGSCTFTQIVQAYQHDSDKRYWKAAFSMAGESVSHVENRLKRQKILHQLLMHMRHDIEMQGLISKQEQSELINDIKEEAAS